MRSLHLSYVLVLLLVSSAGAQTYVSGPVSGDWTSDGNPYVATDTLVVNAGETLSIGPGVDVLFDGHYALMVNGKLRAEGAPEDSISFGPLDPGTPWAGIRFVGAAEGSFLRFCAIEKSEVQGETALTGCGGGIYSEDSSPMILHCRIEDCRASSLGYLEDGGGGIFCLGGSPQIIGNRIEGCQADAFCTGGGGGIGFRDTDIVIRGNEIRGCSVHGFGGGIAGVGSEVEIDHNIIAECSGFHYAGGIGLRECTGRVFDNLIVQNTVPDICGGGIYLVDSPVEILFCTFVSNSVGHGGGFGQGGGLCVSGGTQPNVRNCIFWGNTAEGSGPQIWPNTLVGVDFCLVEEGYPWGWILLDDPRFVSGDGESWYNGYYLSAVAAGQMVDSPCIDAGDRPANASLGYRTTRTDLVLDVDVVDLGFHYPGAEGVTAVPVSTTALVSSQAYPNPFNPRTTIRFELPHEGPVKLEIFDVAGRHLLTLVDGKLPGGEHQVTWDGQDHESRDVSSGTYFYRLEAAGQVRTRPMTLIR